jgi:hypothetical protein
LIGRAGERVGLDVLKTQKAQRQLDLHCLHDFDFCDATHCEELLATGVPDFKTAEKPMFLPTLRPKQPVCARAKVVRRQNCPVPLLPAPTGARPLDFLDLNALPAWVFGAGIL